MNNLMYGQTNRRWVVDNVDNLADKIDANGRTLKADGIIGVLGNLNWTALKDANKVAWALKYLKITEDPGQTISDDYLSLGGGTMKNGAQINWANENVSLRGSTNSLSLSVPGQSISLNANQGINMTNTIVGSLKVGQSPVDDKDAVRYNEVKRLVSQGGMPYILSSSDITGGAPGDITIQASKYSNLPANTIFFVKVAES